jgi:hypothetical protein
VLDFIQEEHEDSNNPENRNLSSKKQRRTGGAHTDPHSKKQRSGKNKMGR